MHAVAEEYPLGVDLEILPVIGLAVTLIVLENILKQVAHRKVPGAVLVPCYVAAVLGCFRKMVCIGLLTEAEFVPSRNLVSHYLEIGEFIYCVPESLRLFLAA